MKVWPKSDDIRKLITHPSGIGFPDDGPAEWPDDSFTHRRISDGDVTNEEQVQTPKSRGTTEVKAKG